MPRNIVVLGSTGSIGRQTLDVVRTMTEHVSVYGLGAHSSRTELQAQIAEFKPAAACLVNGGLQGDGTEILTGEAGLIELVTRDEVDLVVVGTAGRAGMMPTIAALQAGKLVALANKEALVMAGSIIRRILQEGSGELVPIDSEHSAIWQCLQGEQLLAVEQLTLTASGGALRHLSNGELRSVTPEQALRHPTWSMGPKITVDSANLMNKGLEVIEARWLFDIAPDRINLLLHPQSVVHSLVTFNDGSMKAQIGLPDMRLPIQYALSHPERWPTSLPRADLAEIGALTFASVDLHRYPALRIALDAARAGGTAPAVLCSADEVAVAAFLDKQIAFTDIAPLIERVLDRHDNCDDPTLDDILQADIWARQEAHRLTGVGEISA
jgi:1-deoxy-D-xylulose-5-phosphate reductoisomerase